MARRRTRRRVALVVALAVTGMVAPRATASDGSADGADGERFEPVAWAAADDGAVSETLIRGESAVAMLESLDATERVADRAGIEPDVLVDELESDPSMFVSPAGRIGYVEPPVPSDVDDGAPYDAVPLPVEIPADVFALDSRPGVGRVVYLDFDGHTTTANAWNSLFGVEPIVSQPYDVDGSPGSFSQEEQARIYEIWRRVTADFAPFDVNVTTRDPGVDGVVRWWAPFGAADTSYGTRVVISPTDWFEPVEGYTIGGIAYVGVFSSFNWDAPAFVFSSNLGGGNAKYVAEAAAHEVGHTFGLYHDGGTKPNGDPIAYYAGHGDWAPIMGVGYQKAVTQWSRGEYPGADNQEDDVAKIAGHTGFAPDDHGNVAAAATQVSASATVHGLLGYGDVDTFRTTVGSGSLSAVVTPVGAWSNLHAAVRVLDGTGAVVASGAPGQAVLWEAEATADVAAGTYFVEVRGTGWKAPATGFTTYGSMGAYELVIEGGAAPPGSTTTTTTTSPPPATPPPTGGEPDGPVPSAGSRLTAVAPTRLVDTRIGLGGSLRLGQGGEVRVHVPGAPGVPGSATSAVVTVTAVGPSADGFLSVHPCSGDGAATSTVNYASGQTVANTTIATLGTGGDFCVYTAVEADVLVDLTGWLGPDGQARLRPVGPIRVADTREGLGGAHRLPPGGVLQLDLAGDVPAGTSAVALNVTAVSPAAVGHLTVYPCGAALPATSAVNYVAGDVRPNNVIVGLSGAKVCVYSHAESDVVVDLTGTFGADGLSYVPSAPARLLDTRATGGPLAPDGTIRYDVRTAALGSLTPEAASVNVTAVGHTRDGHTTTYDCTRRRSTSTLNQIAGFVAANGAIVPLDGASGSCAWMLGGGHLVVDLTGWWVP